MDMADNISRKKWAYMDEKGALRISSLDEMKARLQNTSESPNSTQIDILRVFHNFIKRLQS